MKLRLTIFFFLFCNLVFAQVTKVDVTMVKADFENLYKRNLDSKKFLPAALTIDGNTYKDAKIRFKGNTSRVYSKKPFRIKFEKNAGVPQLFHGTRHMNFNAMYTDKSFMREKLVWDIFRMMDGFGPKEYGYVNTYFNGVDNGINLLIQHIDEDFLKDNSRAQGDIYEAGYDENQGNLSILSDEMLKKSYEKHVGDENDYSSLKDLIDKLNNTSDADFAGVVNELFDMKTVYDFYILNVLTMQNDTDGKNYYLYRDPSKQTQQWSIIPWDYDITFGRDGDTRFPYPSELLNDFFAYSYEPLAGPENVLKNRLMKDPSLLGEFKQRLNDVLQNVFTEEKLFPLIDNWSAELDEYIKKEPVRWGTYKDFKDHVETLKYFITARRNYLLSTYINSRSGENDIVTVQVSSTGVPYNFTDYDGKRIAVLTFSSLSGLQKVTIKTHPSSIPTGFTGDMCIKRYVEVIPYPAGASFTAELKWEYLNSIDLSEVGTGVLNCNALECYNYNNGSWQSMDSYVNSYGNFVTVSNVNESNCGTGKYFSLKIPDDFRQNWNKEPNLFWQKWYDIKSTGAQNVFVIGDDGTMVKSQDGGLTWKQEFLGIHLQFRTIAAINSSVLYAGGMYGQLLKSNNGGSSWSFLNSGTGNNINCMKFENEQNGWAVCDRGLIITTENSGAKWNAKQVSDSKNLYALELIGQDEILAGGEQGAVYKSEDGGKSWKTISSGTDKRINRFMQIGEREVFGVCNSGVVIYSNDKGNSWTVKQLNTSSNLYGITAEANSEIYVSGENGEIFHSPDGAQWIKDDNQYSNDIQAIAYIHGASGIIAVGNWGAIFQSR
jgi:spore coat protein H